MANDLTIEKAVENYIPENSDPIDWKKDDNTVLLSKINARVDNAKQLHSKKVKEWRKAEAYLDGDPSKVSPNKESLIYNPLFPIVRNMTGLVTDSKPNPSVRIVDIHEETPEAERKIMNKTADNLGVSLEEWWDGMKGQSKLQQWVFGMWLYSDYYVMPYWDEKLKQVMVEAIKPSRVHIDPNADEVCYADYIIIDFYRSKQWMWGKYGKDKCKDVMFADHNELNISFEDSNSSEETLKNVCKLQLYMEADHWAYKAGHKIMESIENPFWALDEDGQKQSIESKIKSKYEKPGVFSAIGKAVDAVKGVVGMETNQDKIGEEVSNAMMSFTPKKNYLPFAKIPLVQFDTYRLGGELYSRSTVLQSCEEIDDINDRKRDIQQNSEYLGKPNIFVDGKIMNEDQAKRIEKGKAMGEVVRMNTGDNKSLGSSFFVAQGIPVPTQFFDNIEVNKRELDNIWGHHEVSRGGSDASNKTKGGILALQEADQTPIRYVTRNIEDALQELFEWVIQIRKIYKPGKYTLDSGQTIDYETIDENFKVYMKSGSMMPVSKEAQRSEVLDLYRSNALDPLTLYERLNDPEPEKTAKRLEMWIKQKTIMTDGMDDQQQRVLEKIQAIQANRFDQVQIQADDDPKIHHDMLLMALKSNQFSPEQEQFMAQLIEDYNKMAEGQQQPMGANSEPMQMNATM